MTSFSTSGCSRRASTAEAPRSPSATSTAADATAFAWEGRRGQARRVLLPKGPEAWAPEASPALAHPPDVDDGPLLLFDATGEGREDLLVTAGGASLPAGAPEYQPRLFLNDGHGHFRPAPEGTLPPAVDQRRGGLRRRL